jgi:predicted DNA-binding protein (UPF0251 family)
VPRPCCMRQVAWRVNAVLFKPAGIPAVELQRVTLTLDEMEALRLADLEGLYQEQAAAHMGISRPTFARIVEVARRKTAEALIHGKALRIEGGAVEFKEGGGMPNRDGTGPTGAGRGQETGCGASRQRRRWRRGRPVAPRRTDGGGAGRTARDPEAPSGAPAVDQGVPTEPGGAP